MHQTRRQFLRATTGGALVGAGIAASAQGAAKPIRMELGKFAASPGKVDQLRSLFSAMRKKKASDPSSYFFQAAVHWLPRLGSADVQSSPDLKVLAEIFEADKAGAVAAMNQWWNKCTHAGQKQKQDFLIWHRAYLYYFERHARKTLSDPTFALPYWDYRANDRASRELPGPFRGASLSGGGENWLYPIRGLPREIDAAGLSLDASLVRTDAMLATDYYFTEVGFSGFGEALQQDPQAIEVQPHNQVHGGVGGWLGTVATAAFDPIFWVHHTNIDRLVNVWLTSRQRYWSRTKTADAVEAWLNESPFEFVDASGVPDRKPRRFFLEQSNLGYVYDTDPPKIPLPQMPPAVQVASAGVSVQGKSVTAIPKSVQSFSEVDAGTTTSPASIPASSGSTYSVPFAPSETAAPGGGGKLPLAVLNQSKSKTTFTVLVLEQVRRRGERGGNYMVFVGPGAEGGRDENSPAYAGTFSTFDAPGPDEPLPAPQYTFDITRQVAGLKGSPQGLQIKIVPLGPVGADGKPVQSSRPGSVEIGRTSIRSRVGSTNPIK